mmetsp:Transcript_8227/g.24740  ORF Transcript_8227/g.24740 Transcript_8227/m.24740 type:complete len:305 (-) Transcript_8227:255-1169(-)|eukprot:CAMPEP_0198728912 /NCGR_PEP_ID=MMETSP1475-20131203/11958_1 /TAXON_ID= ORGANISM="Unidentified sp., Strain CCMP1999" /NCGR_SAMPLE_ID=MMETSP1475 /ASSEMBLY_ACC=CAM_ASM_001111 /LENGTH=304 /DNA_ID=CAMNT_0044491389 /DNA_START=37 /DNA_END=951 /DNA_ORIENTATION=-
MSGPPRRGLLTERPPRPIVFGLFSAVVAVVVALSMNRSRKYVNAIDATCKRALVDIMSPDSPVVCCDARSQGATAVTEMCWIIMYFAPMEKAMSSTLSWILPFIPLLLNIAMNVDRAKKEPLLTRRYTQRALLYIGTMLFRVFILYFGWNFFEKFFQGSETDVCWYAPLRAGLKCKERFNIGDHLVLMMVHYIAIPMFEINAALSEDPRRVPRQVLSVVNKLLTLCAAINMYVSSVYFHSRSETIVAFLLALFAVIIPHSIYLSKVMAEGYTKILCKDVQSPEEMTHAPSTLATDGIDLPAKHE